MSRWGQLWWTDLVGLLNGSVTVIIVLYNYCNALNLHESQLQIVLVAYLYSTSSNHFYTTIYAW